MGKFNKRWFSQIMINKFLKTKLNNLKKIIIKDTLVTSELSYGDVILFLVNHYGKTKQTEYTMEQKLSFSTPLKRKSVNVSTRLDRKQRFSYSLES